MKNAKKWLSLLLVITMLLSLAVSGDSTFFGEGQGKNGAIKVQITVSNNAIMGIKVTQNPDTPAFSEPVYQKLSDSIIKGQNTDVAAVSGATYTSKGFIDAVKKAIAASGIKLVPKAKEQTPVTKTVGSETDVIVVGGGGAGLVTALTAAEKGANVVLLEKTGMLGGATALSGGIVPAAGTRFQKEAGITDTPKAMARDIFRPAHYSQNIALVNKVAENSGSIIDWMEKLGVKWTLTTTFLYNGQTNYRMHTAEGTGAGIVKVLTEKVNNNKNIKVYLETPGTGLVTDTNGNVIGVTAENKEKGKMTFIGKSVVLCTSGFGANKEMIAKYTPSAAKAYPMVAPGATGDGILWGMNLGADVKNMGAYQTYGPISYETKTPLGSTILDNGGFLVNKDAERFCDEYMGYSQLGAEIINQPDAYAYSIFDSNVAKLVADLSKTAKYGTVVSANTIEELAGKLGIDKANLKKALTDYEKGIAKGEDIMNRTKLPKQFAAPYYAVKVTGDLRHTQGGLVTDLNARVLRTDGTAIKGLYAAGGVTEGFSSAGGSSYMSGNGLLQAFVFGRIAGQEAASAK